MASIAILIERIAFCFSNKTWMRYGAMNMKKRVISALVLVSVVVVLIAVAAVTPYRVVCTVLTVDELREMRTEPYQTFLQAMDDAEQELNLCGSAYFGKVYVVQSNYFIGYEQITISVPIAAQETPDVHRSGSTDWRFQFHVLTRTWKGDSPVAPAQPSLDALELAVKADSNTSLHHTGWGIANPPDVALAEDMEITDKGSYEFVTAAHTIQSEEPLDKTCTAAAAWSGVLSFRQGFRTQQFSVSLRNETSYVNNKTE